MLEVAAKAGIHSILSAPVPDMGVIVRPVHDHEIAQALTLAAKDLSAARTSEATLRRVHGINPDSIWGVFRPGLDGAPDLMTGFCAFLILNAKGAAGLLSRAFDLHEIDPTCLAAEPDTADLIYIWAILARGASDRVIGLINEIMVKRYGGRPIYATAGTEAGLRFMLRCGYAPVHADRLGIGALYRRLGVAKAKAPGRPPLKVVPVSTADEFEKALAIRNVFLTEQDCPFEEEFDGNDRMGTLFLGYVGDEPAATLRIRYFASFFKIERLAVLPRFRRTLIAKEVINAAIEFCRRKGYTRCFGHAQRRLVSFWQKFGFRPTGRGYVFNFSGYEYVEMFGDFEPHARALTMDSDPYVIIRPEGRWDELGSLERSAQIPAVVPP